LKVHVVSGASGRASRLRGGGRPRGAAAADRRQPLRHRQHGTPLPPSKRWIALTRASEHQNARSRAHSLSLSCNTAHPRARAPPSFTRRCGRRCPRCCASRASSSSWARSARRPRLGFGSMVVSEKKGTDYLNESGIKRMNGSTKGQCDRTLRSPPPPPLWLGLSARPPTPPVRYLRPCPGAAGAGAGLRPDGSSPPPLPHPLPAHTDERGRQQPAAHCVLRVQVRDAGLPRGAPPRAPDAGHAAADDDLHAGLGGHALPQAPHRPAAQGAPATPPDWARAMPRRAPQTRNGKHGHASAAPREPRVLWRGASDPDPGSEPSDHPIR
jgi:hypothetical protein